MHYISLFEDNSKKTTKICEFLMPKGGVSENMVDFSLSYKEYKKKKPHNPNRPTYFMRIEDCDENMNLPIIQEVDLLFSIDEKTHNLIPEMYLFFNLTNAPPVKITNQHTLMKIIVKGLYYFLNLEENREKDFIDYVNVTEYMQNIDVFDVTKYSVIMMGY